MKVQPFQKIYRKMRISQASNVVLTREKSRDGYKYPRNSKIDIFPLAFHIESKLANFGIHGWFTTSIYYYFKLNIIMKILKKLFSSNGLLVGKMRKNLDDTPIRHMHIPKLLIFLKNWGDLGGNRGGGDNITVISSIWKVIWWDLVRWYKNVWTARVKIIFLLAAHIRGNS